MAKELLDQKIEAFKLIAPSIEVRVRGSKGVEASGQVFIQHWDRRLRIIRALKSLILCWIAAFVTIFIPVVHFIAVPVLILAGPILAFVNFYRQSVVLGGVATCPKCQKPIELVRSSDKWPLTDICESCGEHIRVEKI